MMRGSDGGWVGGRTVTVITREVTASGGLVDRKYDQLLPAGVHTSKEYEASLDGCQEVSGVQAHGRLQSSVQPWPLGEVYSIICQVLHTSTACGSCMGGFEKQIHPEPGEGSLRVQSNRPNTLLRWTHLGGGRMSPRVR